MGKVGQSSLTACGGDLLKAKDIFKKKWDCAKKKKKFQMSHIEVSPVKFWRLLCHRFLDKTKNEWEDRATFDKVAGKYDMVFMDYSTDEKVRNNATNQQPIYFLSIFEILIWRVGNNSCHWTECDVCQYEHTYVSLFQEENQTTVDAAHKKKNSQLDVKIQSLLELICDVKAMEECVLEMKFDTRKAPLGQSGSKSQQKCWGICTVILF